MMNSKIATSIRLDATILNKIKIIAMDEHRSFNAEIEYIADRYIEEYERTKGEIEINL